MPLRVEPVPHETLVFLVWSENKPGTKYRVDLECFYGNGQCDCKDWQIRRRDGLDRYTSKNRPDGGDLWTHRCKHIRAALGFWGLVLHYAYLADREKSGLTNDEAKDQI